MSRDVALHNSPFKGTCSKNWATYLDSVSFEIVAMSTWVTKDRITITKNCHIPTDTNLGGGGGTGRSTPCSSSG